MTSNLSAPPAVKVQAALMLLNEVRSSQTFPKVPTRTHRYCSFIQYRQNHYQHKNNKYEFRGAGSILKVGGAQIPARSAGKKFFTVPSHFFVVPPAMTGHYRKVQGTVTRT